MTYFLEVTFYWTACYLFYFLFLRRNTFFQINRAYLLGTLFLGLALPYLNFGHYLPEGSPLEVLLPAVQISPEQLEQAVFAEAENNASWHWGTLLMGIYLLGALATAGRIFYGFYKINQLKSNSKKEQWGSVSLQKTDEIHTPFSFFNTLFWSNRLNHLSDTEQRQIVLHEQAHMTQWHSLDVVLVELITIAFWWNPLVYLFKNRLRETHEFLADDYVIRQTNKQQYGHLLILQSRAFSSLLSTQNAPVLANHFFHSQLKKRIIMMTSKKSQPTDLLKYLLIFPLMAMLVFACESVIENEMPEIDELTAKKINESGPEFVRDTIITFNPETMQESVKVVKTEVYKKVDEMPRFPGCEDEPGGQQAIEECATNALLTNIYMQIKYPAEARKAGVEGMVVASFIVGSFGGITNAKIVRNLSPECDAEVLRVIKEMPRWEPGKKDGQKVNVRYTLPVKFKLS